MGVPVFRGDFMTRFILAAVAALFLPAAAFAQDAPPPTPPAVQPGPMMPAPPPSSPPPRPDGPGRPDWMAMHHRMMATMQKSGGFRFRRGDDEIDIKCADNESMKACADAASTLIDKVFGSAK
jgi:hypothetical protein